jgi:cobalt-zinc-cadmium efflux system membrane fusion protein
MPGTFVTGFSATDAENLPVVIPRDAVQSIEGKDVVFVEHEGEFEMTPVTLGRSDRERIEIAAGLDAGTRYVSEGAFQLKATVITSNLDSHAGHGH